MDKFKALEAVLLTHVHAHGDVPLTTGMLVSFLKVAEGIHTVAQVKEQIKEEEADDEAHEKLSGM